MIVNYLYRIRMYQKFEKFFLGACLLSALVFVVLRLYSFETFSVVAEQIIGQVVHYELRDRHKNRVLFVNAFKVQKGIGVVANDQESQIVMNSSADFEQQIPRKQFTLNTNYIVESKNSSRLVLERNNNLLSVRITVSTVRGFDWNQNISQAASMGPDEATLHKVNSPVVNTFTAKEVKMGDTGKHRCVGGLDTSNRSAYWRFNDEVFPGLHDAFAKWDTLNMIFLVRDWRKRKDFTRRNKDWSCDFADCGSRRKGKFVLDSKGSASTQIVRCDVPGPCLARWKAADPNLTQARRVTVTARSDKGASFRYEDVEFCIYPPVPAAPAARHVIQLAACTMMRESLGRNGELVLEWLAYHRLQGFERFLIYSNEDCAALRAALRPQIEEGVVDVLDWQWPESKISNWAHQIPQLNSCVQRFRGVAKCAPPAHSPVPSPHTHRPREILRRSREAWVGLRAPAGRGAARREGIPIRPRLRSSQLPKQSTHMPAVNAARSSARQSASLGGSSERGAVAQSFLSEIRDEDSREAMLCCLRRHCCASIVALHYCHSLAVLLLFTVRIMLHSHSEAVLVRAIGTECRARIATPISHSNSFHRTRPKTWRDTGRLARGSGFNWKDLGITLSS